MSRALDSLPVPTVVTLPAYDDAPALEAQLAFHLHAGAIAVVVHGAGLDDGSRAVVERFIREGAAHVRPSAAEAEKAAEELGAGWIIAAAPYEFYWPRGARYDAILSRVPSEYDVVLGLVRAFLRVEGEPSEPFRPGIHRLSPQAYYQEPDDSLLPERRLVRRVGLNVSDPGEIPSSALRPFRGWYPIEVLSFPRTDTLSLTEVEHGLERGVLQRDLRLRDMLDGLAAGEPPEFARPSLVDAAWYAADAAVLGEADTFRVQERLDGVERRLAGLEESLVVRVDRKLRSALRRGRGRP